MHPRSRRNTKIGLAGLAWFLFCDGAAAICYFQPHLLREWSHFTWTDQEIAIGSACYAIVGLAGGILAVTRLFLPIFRREPLIGYNMAAPLMAIDVKPQFEEFHAVNAITAARAARAKVLVTLFAGVVIFIMIEHPDMRHEGVPFRTAVAICGSLLIAHAVVQILRASLFCTRLCSKIRWNAVSRHREMRRYHVFEEGLLVQARSYSRVVPWYEVRCAHLIGQTLGMAGGGELIIIPNRAMPSQTAVDQLLQVLVRNSVAYQVKAAINTAARRG